MATFFADKGTHTTDSGAQFNAARVIAGLKSLPGDPLENFFSATGEAVETYKTGTQIISTNQPNSNKAMKGLRHLFQRDFFGNRAGRRQRNARRADQLQI